MKLLRRYWPILIIILTVIIYFKPFIFDGKLPVPADTIVGMYHPWRDKTWDNLIAGVPFKNFLITDPVRQQYPWRELAIMLFKKGELPLWNPYSFSGTPLLANLQSAAFYPLNLLFGFLPFAIVWTVLIILEPVLAGLFLYLYLRFFKLEKPAALIGALSFAFSGFFVAWNEWGTILHVALWLPLILLAKEKLIVKKTIPWIIVLIFAESSMILAGHLQTSFYMLLFTTVYLIMRVYDRHNQEVKVRYNAKKSFLGFVKNLLPFAVFGFVSLLITLPQLLPTIQFILHSSRALGQIDWQTPGWFIPWQHLIQFLAPDFFGNPSTLNYWGEWNYGEFIGYIGIMPLIFAFFALLLRRDKKTLFFSLLAFFSLIFALPTPLAKLPYELKISLLSTSQPTRLLFLVDFSLAILAALGLDHLIKITRSRRISLVKYMMPTLITVTIVLILFLIAFFAGNIFSDQSLIDNLTIAKRNLYLPVILVVISSVWFLIFLWKERVRNLRIRHSIEILLILIVTAIVTLDQLRFMTKFNSFSNPNWLFPSTKTIEYLKKDLSLFRFMTTDRRLFPPNFSVVYRLQSIEGYDPLFINRYGELMAAWARKKPDISPLSFNRIITPQDYESKFADLLNVKYVLSLRDENSPKLEKVYQEGETRVYRNKNVFPRVFFAADIIVVDNKQKAIEKMFDPSINFNKTVIIEENIPSVNLGVGKVTISQYSENKITLETQSDKDGFLFLSEVYYPSWKATIDNKPSKIYITDYVFRGLFIPKGNHDIIFQAKIL